MTIIAALRAYFSGCTLLSGGTLHVDFLTPEWDSYSLDAAQTEPIVKYYCDGSTRRQQDFNIISRCSYSPEIITQLENIGFYESIQEWIEKQTALRNFPDLGSNRKCISIKALSCGYPVGEDETSAYYQISLRLTYTQEAYK